VACLGLLLGAPQAGVSINSGGRQVPSSNGTAAANADSITVTANIAG